MRLPDVECARIVRDGGIEALDALNAIVTDAASQLSPAEQRQLRRAVATAMSCILDALVNPALKQYPELDVDEDTWGAIAASRSRSRGAGNTDR
jgi:DNA-binding transcriptional LysR family regulator